jgi:hypothetical protein
MDGTLMVTKCRECGQPLHAHLCMNTIMVMCCNPRCALYQYDLDAKNYETLDLSNYKRRRYEQAS